MIPVLMISYNRLAYTQQALAALLNAEGIKIVVIDNASTDGTQAWLRKFISITLIENRENRGIAGAMNQFLTMTRSAEYVGKVDNDTLVPPTWATVLREKAQACGIDIIQAKHAIPPAVYYGKSFDEWVAATMPACELDPSVFLNHFVGGSGIIFRRDRVRIVPPTEWKLGGWREFQRRHPRLKKAFCTDVEVTLLDADGYHDYPDYYKQTGRI